MKILFSITNLEIGGAQKFVLNLAASFAKNNVVYIFDHRPEDRNHTLAKEYQSKNVKIISFTSNPLLLKVIWKINKTLKQLGFKINFRDWLNIKYYKYIINSVGFDIIHSHLALSDITVCSHLPAKKTPILITMHGDYDKDPSMIEDPYVINAVSNISKLMNTVDAIIYLTQKSITPFEKIKTNGNKNVIFKKINNALFYNQSVIDYNSIEHINILKNRYNITPNSFIYGMVARGIKQKGWEEAIVAFLEVSKQLKNRNIDPKFIAIGGGELLDKLKKQYSNEKSIHFIGEVSDPMNYIPLFNVGLLPSYRECYPNVIMEYIWGGKPVIATKTGDIAQMILSSKGSCGILVNSNPEGSPKVEELITAMLDMALNNELYLSKVKLSEKTKENFSVSTCIDNHLSLYKNLILDDK